MFLAKTTYIFVFKTPINPPCSIWNFLKKCIFTPLKATSNFQKSKILDFFSIKFFFWLDTLLKISNIDLTVNFTLEDYMWEKKNFFFGEIDGGGVQVGGRVVMRVKVALIRT